MASLLDKAVDISTTIKRNGGRISKPQPIQEAAVVPPVEIPVYNAKADMERMQNIDLSQVANSKLPPAILNEMVQNPINVAAPEELSGVGQVMGGDMSKMERSLEIQRRMDSMDVRAPRRNPGQGYALNEGESEIPTTGYTVTNRPQVDYSMIKMIMEKVIDDRLGRLKSETLNEGHDGHTGPRLSIMALGDKFTFVDSDDNVYEAKIEYKGRRKSKPKK